MRQGWGREFITNSLEFFRENMLVRFDRLIEPWSRVEKSKETKLLSLIYHFCHKNLLVNIKKRVLFSPDWSGSINLGSNN